MDKNRFDGLTRQLAQRENRRQALKTLLAGGLGTAAAVVVGGEAEAAKTDCCPQTAPTLCDLTCTDTINDAGNCGGCGVTCAAGERCYRSACESVTVTHCTEASECAGSDTECQVRTCKQGTCGFRYTDAGKAVATQLAGDCRKNVCDGAGNVISIVDDRDTPPKPNQCSIGICLDGRPDVRFVNNGKRCGDGGRCDNGVCRGQNRCSSASECPGTDNACQSRTCTNGNCGISYVANGTALPNQVAGNCQTRVCDGVGNTVSIADDADIRPADECQTYSCSAGELQTQAVTIGTPCSGGFCNGAGFCVQCLAGSDCPATGSECETSTCTSGFCGTGFVPSGTVVSTQTAGDCQVNVCDGAGGVTSIPDDNDAPSLSTGDECIDSICSGGVPSRPPKIAGTRCGFGVCDSSGVCVECVSPADCIGGVINATTTCSGNICGYTCNSGYGDCNPGPDGCETNFLTDNEHCGACGRMCASGQSCNAGVCV